MAIGDRPERRSTISKHMKKRTFENKQNKDGIIESNFHIFHQVGGEDKELRLSMIDVKRIMHDHPSINHFVDLRNNESLMKTLLSRVEEYRRRGGRFVTNPDSLNIISSLEILDSIKGAKSIPIDTLITAKH